LKILNHHIFYPPEPVGVAVYAGQMCAWLARRGHEVRVICPPPYYPRWKVQDPYKAWRYGSEIRDGVHVTRCPIWIPRRPGGVTRALYALSFALSSLPVLIREMFRRPDVVFVTEPSFLNAVLALAAAKCCGARSWMHVQDFELDIAFKQGHFRVLRGLESFIMRRFDVVSTISGRMMERLVEKGVEESRNVLFPNWVDPGAIYPMDEPSPLRGELGIPDDAVVTLFSGSMGAKQGIEQLIAAARLLVDQPLIQVVICGEGAGLAGLQALAKDLPNVRFLPLQSLERLNALLNMADVHALPQKEGFADLVMPSKLIGMMASGRPVIATARHGSEVANIVQWCGIVTPPEDPVALAGAIVALSENASERMRLGAKARSYAVQHFDRESILRAFEAKVSRAVLPAPGFRAALRTVHKTSMNK